jgi:hypothetical protein
MPSPCYAVASRLVAQNHKNTAWRNSEGSKNSAPHLPTPTVQGARVPQRGGLIEATAAPHTQRQAPNRPNEHAGFLRLPAPCNPRPVLDGGTETSPRHPLEIPLLNSG